jgi:hypothetical protein
MKSLSTVEIRAIEAASPQQWIEEALVLREDAYAIERHDGGRLDADYAARYAPVIDMQLLKAGLRMAALLNTIFGD